MLSQGVSADAATNVSGEVLKTCRAAGQFLLLWGVAQLAHRLTTATHLPLPGNVVALTLLYVLLELGVVRGAWVEDAASLLIKHMSLFFVPLAVGALAYGALFAAEGVATLTVVVFSGALGIVAAGRTVVALQRRR